MLLVNELTYPKLKKKFESALARGAEPSDRFMCKLPPTNKVYFDIEQDQTTYGLYTKEQNGYKRAQEIVPVPAPTTCETCGQVTSDVTKGEF